MEVPEVFRKNSLIKINFLYKNVQYTITGNCEVTDKILKINLGSDSDFSCIKLVYHYYPNYSALEVLGITAKYYADNNNIGKILTCMDPPLPERGSLDILVMLSLAIAKYIDPKCQVFIDDKAQIDGKDLSWLKYFDKRETTYSKFGFIMRDDESVDDHLAYPIFRHFMDIELQEIMKMKIKDIYNKTILDEIKKLYDTKIGLPMSVNDTLEKTIRDFLKVGRNVGRFIDKGKYDFINLQGIWELSWYYYDNNINESQKIQNLRMEAVTQ